MHRLALLVACAGCDGLFRVDEITPSDATGSSDARVDAAPPADAQQSFTHCDMITPAPQFCLDFDQGKYSITQFTKLVQGSGMIMTTADTSVSSPNEMVATVTGGSTVSTAFGEYDFVRPDTGLIDFWVRIPNNGCHQDVAVLSWPSVGELVTVSAGSASLSASSSGTTTCTVTTSQTAPVTLDLWNRVAFSIVNQRDVAVTIGGTNVLSMTCSSLVNSPILQVGARAVTASSVCITELDDVIVH